MSMIEHSSTPTDTTTEQPKNVPIQEALQEAGLITESESKDIPSDKALTVVTPPRTVPAISQTQPSNAANSHDLDKARTQREARLARQEEARLARREAARRHMEEIERQYPTKKNEPAGPVDPDDVPDEHNFTPRMRRWVADPGFPVLMDWLSQKRYHGSAAEMALIDKHLMVIPGMTRDKYGNCIVDIGEFNGVLWSCHTDTVHYPNEKGDQPILISKTGKLFLDNSKGRLHSCLGADDGTGVWIMLEMIKANVPGRYVFHYGEESGCIGSGKIRDFRPEVLKDIKYAIAFDRAGTSDVITHQRSSRCCSDAFAMSIAAQLPGKYMPARGVYTDTAEYKDVVPECTNLSVGYKGQHTSNEEQDLVHLYALRDAMIKIDPSKFVCERDPSVREVSTFRGSYSGGGWGRGYYEGYEEALEETEEGALKGLKNKNLSDYSEDELRRVFGTHDYSNPDLHERDGTSHRSPARRKNNRMGEDETSRKARQEALDKFRSDDRPPRPHDIQELIRRYPEETADVIDQMGLSVHDFWDQILSSLGKRNQ